MNEHLASTQSLPRMSIVIGTLNRADVLGRSIESVAHQDFPADQYEIIVVDNGSTDGTEALCSQMCGKIANLRYVKEPKLGLSNARNRGIAEAKYELVAFFDDDATAEPGWLASLMRVFRENPDVGAAGGPIQVGWPTTRPEWMPASCEGYFGHCWYGPERRDLHFPEYPYGSNMVIRRDLLLKIDGFNAKVGPTGQNMMSAGEQDLFTRLYQLPLRVVWEPAATVHHWVQPDRVNRKWVLRRAMKYGVSNVHVVRNTQQLSLTALLGRLTRAAVQTLIGVFSVVTGFLGRRNSAVIVSRMAVTAYWIGAIKAWMSALRGQLSQGQPSPTGSGARLS